MPSNGSQNSTTSTSERSWSEVVAENERLRTELAEKQSREKQLETALIEMRAENQQLRALLSEAQAQIGQLVVEKRRLEEQIKEEKQKPFKSGNQSGSEGTSAKDQKRGKRHQGSGRKRPQRVDYTEFIPVGGALS